MGIGNIADTGMRAAMSNMEVISHNIANANTIGFKKSFINFADIYPSANGASNQIGLGVDVSSVNQNFATGSYTYTNQPLDLGINGNGFFIVKDPSSGQISYTRAGRFEPKQGYITFGNHRLQGFTAVNGTIPAGSSITDLQISNASLPASATTNVQIKVNLDSNSTVPGSVFDPNDSTSYNYQSTANIYDSLGNTHAVTSYYVKTAANNWNVNVYVDGVSVGSGSMTFTTSGQLSSSTGLGSLSYSPTTGATSPQAFALDMTGSTQYGSANSVNLTEANGYAPGLFSGVNIDSDGKVYMQYTNSQKLLAGQVAIANFQSPEGLIDIGNMSWIASADSGSAIVNQNNSIGNIRTGYVELSNVDLTTEMVNLLSAQHTFQANAQVENTYNEVMQTVIKL
ncbi:Flagellar hook protein FlgE [Aquicella siphonis]|uniref:Flagellar hook protein FlgE n=1 Tax=Aquicella siphonis TaxID=254247 RepID=A0A5E4PKL9_9COXI|nr:flagellar hook protein FlgE [Aquicella siphonis]VVC77098.1 Flagellar hook protein FlgE [Aquicella siphonis]